MACWINQERAAYWKPPQHKTNVSILCPGAGNTPELTPTLSTVSVKSTAQESKVVNEKVFFFRATMNTQNWVRCI
jgi:hypothetical protein